MWRLWLIRELRTLLNLDTCSSRQLEITHWRADGFTHLNWQAPTPRTTGQSSRQLAAAASVSLRGSAVTDRTALRSGEAYCPASERVSPIVG